MGEGGQSSRGQNPIESTGLYYKRAKKEWRTIIVRNEQFAFEEPNLTLLDRVWLSLRSTISTYHKNAQINDCSTSATTTDRALCWYLPTTLRVTEFTDPAHTKRKWNPKRTNEHALRTQTTFTIMLCTLWLFASTRFKRGRQFVDYRFRRCHGENAQMRANQNRKQLIHKVKKYFSHREHALWRP